MTVNEFVQNQINTWGFDYIEDLFDRGYEPTMITDNVGNGKWIWLQTTKVTSKHN